MTNNKVNGDYAPGAAYEDFLKAKRSSSFFGYMSNIKRLLGMDKKIKHRYIFRYIKIFHIIVHNK